MKKFVCGIKLGLCKRGGEINFFETDFVKSVEEIRIINGIYVCNSNSNLSQRGYMEDEVIWFRGKNVCKNSNNSSLTISDDVQNKINDLVDELMKK